MAHATGFNFLPPQQNRLRLLQAGALVAVLTCAILSGVLMGSPGKQTATLSDAIASPATTPPESVHVSALPKPISEGTVVSVAAGSQSDTVRYYERETGRAFSVNLRTLKTDILSDAKQSGFIRSYWLPYTNRVVSELQKPDGIWYQMFDFQTKSSATIGSAIAAFTVSPDGRQVAYLKATDDASALFISNNDGTNPRKLMTTRAQEVLLDWPVKNALTMASHRSDRPGTDLSAIDLQGALTVMMSNRENLEYAWSPDGTRLLYSYYTPEQGVSLWYQEAGSGLDVPMGLATSARKCAWHGNTLVITCGVPAKSSLGPQLPANQSSTVDDIVTLDMTTGEQNRRYGGVSSSLIGVIDPIVSSSEKYFVFTNLFNQRLYLFQL